MPKEFQDMHDAMQVCYEVHSGKEFSNNEDEMPITRIIFKESPNDYLRFVQHAYQQSHSLMRICF